LLSSEAQDAAKTAASFSSAAISDAVNGASSSSPPPDAAAATNCLGPKPCFIPLPLAAMKFDAKP